MDTDELQDYEKAEDYEKALAAGVPRQLARLGSNFMPIGAYIQLADHTFIFHYKQAWEAFVGTVKMVFSGRCIQCGVRHFGPTKVYTVNGKHRGGCYGCGWLRSWKYIPTSWWYRGRHGED